MAHFAIAERFGADPQAVLDEWDLTTYEDALSIIAAEGRYRDRHPGKK